MRERDVERKLVRAVRDSGGLALKFVSPGFNGVPDRLLLLPGGRIAFCEVKAPGEKPRPLQLRRMEQLRAMGFQVYVIDSAEQVAGIIREASAVIPARAEGRVERSRFMKAEGGLEGDLNASAVISTKAEGRVERSRFMKAEGGLEGDRKALQGKEKR